VLSAAAVLTLAGAATAAFVFATDSDTTPGSAAAVSAPAAPALAESTAASTAAPVAAPSSSARSVDSSAASVEPTATASATSSAAQLRLADLVADRSPSSTSVAALDVTTGASVHVGASSGMTTASIVKVQLLESLLLKHQRAGTELSDSEVDTVTAMIEHSDNGAAETTFWDVGGRDAVVDLESALGLSKTKTVPGSDDYWGLTTTSAQQQLVLLNNLVSAQSPLTAANRHFVLGLMRNVEADQTWGVPVAASSGTTAVKNGWLAVTDDSDLWAVNSIGVLTVHGDTVLVSVMTQHDSSFDGGVDRVQTLAKAAVAALG
jgi:hypothetical protein